MSSIGNTDSQIVCFTGATDYRLSLIASDNFIKSSKYKDRFQRTLFFIFGSCTINEPFKKKKWTFNFIGVFFLPSCNIIKGLADFFSGKLTPTCPSFTEHH